MRNCGIDLYTQVNNRAELKMGICNICFFFGHCRIEHDDYVDVSYDYMIESWRNDYKGQHGLFVSGEWPVFYSEEMFEYMCPISDEIYNRENDIFLIWQSVLNQIKRYRL